MACTALLEWVLDSSPRGQPWAGLEKGSTTNWELMLGAENAKAEERSEQARGQVLYEGGSLLFQLYFLDYKIASTQGG